MATAAKKQPQVELNLVQGDKKNRAETTVNTLRAELAKSHNGLIQVTPELALRILAYCNFEGQRKISRPRVYSHGYAIREGDWVEDYPIHFAVLPDGRIIKQQDAADELQEIFDSWHQAVYQVDVMHLCAS